MRTLAAALLWTGLALALGGCGESGGRASGAAAPGAPAPPPTASQTPVTGDPPVMAEAPLGGEPASSVNFDEVINPVAAGNPHVRFIAIPGCVQCEKIGGILAIHRAKNPTLKGDQFSSITKAGRRYLKENQLGNHGVVVYDKAGHVVWKNLGHTLDEPGLAGAIASVTRP